MKGIFVLSAAAAVVVLLALVELLRRKHLREKYAVLWMAVSLTTVVLVVVPSTLNTVAGWLGVADPPNLLLFLAAVFLLLVCVHLSYEASRLESRVRTLAEETGLLRLEVERLREDAAPRA